MHAIGPEPTETLLLDSDLVRVVTMTGDAEPAACASKPYRFAFHRTAIDVETAGDSPVVGNANFVTFDHPGRAYRRFAIGSRRDSSDWFCIDPARVRGIRELPTHGSRAPIDADTYVLERRVMRALEDGRCMSAARIVRLLERVANQVCRHAAAAQAARLSAPARHAVHDAEVIIVSRQLDESPSLEAIAGHVGMSRFHFCRVFRRETGYSFPGYRRSLRLRSSLELIVGSAKLIDVAVTLGFASHSHFTGAFHDEFGCTPSAMRRAGNPSPSSTSSGRLIATALSIAATKATKPGSRVHA